jgi:dGTPase
MTDRFALNMHDRLFDADATARMTPLLGAPPERTATTSRSSGSHRGQVPSP